MFTTIKFYISVFLLFFITTVNSQVAIGTTTPDDGSALEIESTNGALVPPRMSESDMNAIPTPLDGAVVFNTDKQKLVIRSNGNWIPLSTGSAKSIVLNKDYGTTNNGVINSNGNTYQDFPLSAGDILEDDNTIFEFLTKGSIKVNVSGVYFMSAALSIRNLPATSTKYVLAVERNGDLIGYLTRGNVELPNSDFWGASGSLMYSLEADDELKFRYVINNGNITTFNARFMNIGINKIN
ncbi:hypothetical protein [Marixanthomonas ophiurae]|uniref:C1q domain-containing protein n=1 Tax=Marixanthomonas ophiurae TaxID=387659 RepID=A0A3E1Q8Z5_9FLAO|nr:hypothetical protein [Marixanthomonas ophiurae]RFN58599.1 hypothetical protein DZ858_00530 [Marixanthomonas ophiurae]